MGWINVSKLQFNAQGTTAMFLALTQDKTDSQSRQGWITLIWAKAITEKKRQSVFSLTAFALIIPSLYLTEDVIHI